MGSINQQPVMPPQAQPMQSMIEPKKSGGGFIKLLFVAIVFLGIGIAVGLYTPLDDLLGTSTDSDDTTLTPEPTVEVTVEPTVDVLADGKECTSTPLGFTITIPESWTCEVDDVDETQGSVTIEGDGIMIQSSNLGRGGPCSGVGEEIDSCTETIFFENDNIALTLYENEGDATVIEVFGGLTVGEKPWMSLTWTDMGTEKLTDAQNAAIQAVLGSIVEN